ncbi:hypothetical protein C2G38_48356 [Gigaspora rosea]|uniref:Transmembrane protein n=1 Tax=Gigaspora rosea TaxID=44941 RepID=A0A397UX73_9GLOM|nr:hypothetical protein C2G38_48356 [Gigaspora rosea]
MVINIFIQVCLSLNYYHYIEINYYIALIQGIIGNIFAQTMFRFIYFLHFMFGNFLVIILFICISSLFNVCSSSFHRFRLNSNYCSTFNSCQGIQVISIIIKKVVCHRSYNRLQFLAKIIER